VTPFSQHVGSKQNEPTQFQPRATGGSFGAGVLLSVGLHAALIGFVIFGLPIFWEPEVLPGAIGIELAQLSDITAAPKVQKEGKPNKQPTPQPEVKKEEPKKETPPPPPAAPSAAAPPPPPPAEEEVAEAIPDPAAEKKKEEEKKKEDEKKKAEEEKKKKKEADRKKKEEEKKRQKEDDAALEKMLANLTPDKPAPEPDKKPEKPKKSEAKPAEPSTGPQTELASPIALTASEEGEIQGLIERNWNLGSLAGSPDLAGMMVHLRITLQPDGTVTRVEVLNTGSSPFFRQAAESAVRAVMVSSPLPLPPGKSHPAIQFRFYPDQVVQ
jgi:TonB family protein